MVNLTGLEQSQLNALLEEGTPLVVWITQEYEEPANRESFTWTLPDGTQYIPYDNLHCVVVVGTEGDAYRVADPIRGWQSVDQEVFWKSFDGMGRRAVTVDKGLKGEAGDTLAAFSQEDSTGELDIASRSKMPGRSWPASRELGQRLAGRPETVSKLLRKSSHQRKKKGWREVPHGEESGSLS